MIFIKIIHVLSSSAFSGAEKVACNIIEGLSEEHTSFYVSPDGEIKKTLEKRNINHFLIKNLNLLELRKAIKNIKPDIIHAHDFRASIISTLCCKTIPVISHIHGNNPLMNSKNIYSYAYLLSNYRIDKILVVSNSVIEEFIFKKRFKKKYLTVGNPIDLQSISQLSNQFEVEEEFELLFVGRFSSEKNPFDFIDIVEELVKRDGSIKAIMIGEGKLKEECRSIIINKELENNIKLTGFVDNPYPYMKKCKILVMPSKWEGFGLVAIEALSLGKPVIASNVGGLKSIIDNQCGALCRDKLEFIEEAEKLIKNEGIYFKKSNSAIKKASQYDNFKSYCSLVNNIYQQLI